MLVILVIRTLLFKTCLIAATFVQVIVYAPFYFFLPRRVAWRIVRVWVRSIFWLQRSLVKTVYKIDGKENIPDTPCIIAVKHQSTWDTLVLALLLHDPAFILKRELLWIPGFGWYLAKTSPIFINRSKPIKSLKDIVKIARKKIAEKRQIIIYPEGTRQIPGAIPNYKIGIAWMYSELKLPVVPVAHNAGLYWPKRDFCCYGGTIRCRILPKIAPGMNKQEFMKHLEITIETACDELLLFAEQEEKLTFLPLVTQERLKRLKNLY